MLAAHLQRLTRREPVRYAHAMNDPAVAQALQNYIRLHLRAWNLPATLQHAAQNQPELGELHQHPLISGALGALMEEGHPVDLMAYLDLLDQHGYRRNPSPNFPITDLNNLHREISHQIADPQPHTIRGFSDEALRHPDLARHVAMRQSTALAPALRTLVGVLGRQGHPRHFQVSSLLNSILHGDSSGVAHPLMRMYDEAHKLTGESVAEGMADRAERVRSLTAQTLGHQVMSALDDYGREGRFPQS